MSAKQITINLHKGTPHGLKTVQLSNWDGTIVVCPRNSLQELRHIDAGILPAVYFLLGDENKIYVGETDTLSARLKHHAGTKDFWHEFVAFTAPSLTKTEVRYLEYALVKKISDDGFADLQNTSVPKEPAIATVTKEIFNEFAQIAADVLVSIGYSFLTPSTQTQSQAAQGILVHCSGPHAEAKAVYSSDGVLVMQGSLARKGETNTIPPGAKQRRDHMISNGLLVDQGDSFQLEKDTLFASPSMAAAVFLARSANGRTEWKTDDGKDINELS